MTKLEKEIYDKMTDNIIKRYGMESYETKLWFSYPIFSWTSIDYIEIAYYMLMDEVVD